MRRLRKLRFCQGKFNGARNLQYPFVPLPDVPNPFIGETNFISFVVNVNLDYSGSPDPNP